jgi:uncharacterized membrane protein YccC
MTDGADQDARPPGAWSRVRADVLRFQPAGVRWRPGLRMAIGTAIPLGIGYAAGSWAAGAAAAGGALSVGISSVIAAPRLRVAVLTSTAAAMALGTFVGSATSGYAGLHVVAVAAFVFGCGLLVAVEPVATAVGLNAVVGLVVYGRFPASAQTALQSAGLVAAGGLFQVVLALVVGGRARVGRALTGLSRAYAELSSYAAALDSERSGLPTAAAIDAAVIDREFALSAGATGAAAEASVSLADEARRIRLELLSLAGARAAARRVTKPDDVLRLSFDRLAASTAAFLDLIVTSLAQGVVAAGINERLTATREAIEALRAAAETTASPLAAARAGAAGAALAGQLRAVASLLPQAVDEAPIRGSLAVRSAGQVSRRGAHGAEAIVERMWANLTWRSDALQHAVRLAVVVSAAALIAHAVGIGRGYWAALTAVLVLRPEFSVTFTRGFGRAIGTFVGVGVATAIALAAHPHGWALVVLVGIFAAVAGALFSASYTAFTVAVTGAVIFLLAGLGADTAATARDRLVSTVLGAALALGAYAVWPTWGRRRVADAVADLADAARRYVGLVLAPIIEADAPATDVAAAGRAVRLARTNAEAAIERSLGDPTSRRIDHALTDELLATFRRLAIAAHTLRLSPGIVPLDVRGVLSELAAGIDEELGAIAARLRFGRVTIVRVPLRALHRQLAEVRPAEVAEFMALVVAEADEIVDATNSLADLLDRSPDALRTFG